MLAARMGAMEPWLGFVREAFAADKSLRTTRSAIARSLRECSGLRET